MPARIIRPPCTRYQSECRLTVWRIASRIAWAAASSDMVMVRLHSTNVHQKILRRESAVLATLTRQMMTGVRWCMFLSQREVERFRLQLVAASRQRAKPLYRSTSSRCFSNAPAKPPIVSRFGENIRLSSYLANPLSKRADGDGCVGSYLN